MKPFTRILFYLSGILVLLGLSACGGGEPGAPSTNPNLSVVGTTTTIHAVSVSGTSARINDVAPINPSVNNGTFTIGWQVTSSDPYRVEVYASIDDTISAEDVRVFQQNCGSIDTLYQCNESASFECHFNSSNELYCGTLSPGTNPANDLTRFLVSLPMNANLIFQACDAILASCQVAMAPVQFQ